MQKKTSVREYDKRAKELVERVQNSVSSWTGKERTEKARQERVERAKNDLLYFCKTYLDHHFTNPWERGHKEINEVCDTWNKLLVIRGFRGLGKSTLVDTGRALQAVLANEVPFILFLADDDDTSAMNALAVKVELEHNAKIREDFGDLVGDKWEEKQFKTDNGVKIICKSHRSLKRGVRFVTSRPGMVFADDFDNLHNTINQEQIDKRVDFLLGEIVPAMHSSDWQIYFCCNKVRRKDMGTQLAELDGSVLVDIPAEHPGSGRPYHPKSFPRKKLDSIKSVIGTVRYNREYLLKITSDSEDDFQEDWFVMIDKPQKNYRFKIAFLDPSVGSTRSHDSKAIIELGFGDKYVDVVYAWVRNTSLNHMLRACYEIYKRDGYQWLGVESNGFQILLKDKLRDLEKQYGFALPIKLRSKNTNKNLEIMSLQPGIEHGTFRFVKNNAGDMERLIDEFLGFDSKTTNNHDDGLDAMAQAWVLGKRILGIGNSVEAEEL